MGFHESLDKYLTTAPEDDFDNWCDDLLGEKLSDEFYRLNEDWIEATKGTCEKWINKLFNCNKSPTEAALIIERAYKLYVKYHYGNN